MPRPSNGAMARVDACRGRPRRQLMILASEMEARGETVSAKALSERSGLSLSNTSYYVVELAKAGALEVEGGAQFRGAWQKHYRVSEAFKATMTDSAALDLIAELIDDGSGTDTELRELVRLVQATGRPVGA